MTEKRTRTASCNPVNLTIPLKVLNDVKTNTFTKPTKEIALLIPTQSNESKIRLFLIKSEMKIAKKLAKRSRNKINQRGTMFILFRKVSVLVYVICFV